MEVGILEVRHTGCGGTHNTGDPHLVKPTGCACRLGFGFWEEPNFEDPQVFFCFLYLSSVFIMVTMLSYLYHHRNEAFEAVVKGKKQTRRLLFSLKGEHINLYLRGGIISLIVFAMVAGDCDQRCSSFEEVR
ncbi:unnamed protein product [Schistocephalus solidus]|uniref:Copper transporter n=1 Tax=Schistocephalus solidus TaxID=70667 RepID=A0A183T1M2_SCHSO|nr:unnamed protein product [Schistocephalus solidus]